MDQTDEKNTVVLLHGVYYDAVGYLLTEKDADALIGILSRSTFFLQEKYSNQKIELKTETRFEKINGYAHRCVFEIAQMLDGISLAETIHSMNKELAEKRVAELQQEFPNVRLELPEPDKPFSS